MNLTQIFSEWVKEKRQRVKKTTLSAYIYLMELRVLPVFGQHEHMTTAELQQFVNQCYDQGLSRNSINATLSVLKLVVNYGIMREWFTAEPSQPYLPPHLNKNQPEVFNIQEEAQLICHLLKQATPLDAAVLLSITAGLRLGEICGLQFGDIQLSDHSCMIQRTVSVTYSRAERRTALTVNVPKTVHSYRTVPLHPTVEALLSARMKKFSPPKPDVYFFTEGQKPLHPNQLRSYYRRTLNTLRLPKLRFHALRHTFATRCIESGCDVKTLSAILGHANVQTTLNLYVHPSMEQKQRSIRSMMYYVMNNK